MRGAFIGPMHVPQASTAPSGSDGDDGDLDFRPRPSRRTATELLYHMYLRRVRAGFKGYMQSPEESEAALMTSVSDLMAYAESCQVYASDALA